MRLDRMSHIRACSTGHYRQCPRYPPPLKTLVDYLTIVLVSLNKMNVTQVTVHNKADLDISPSLVGYHCDKVLFAVLSDRGQ
jgi:hypothetical protein